MEAPMSADPLRERLDEIAPRPEDLSPLATVNQHQEIDCWCFGTHAEGLHGFYERERDRSRMADALRAVLDLCDHTTSYAAGTRIPVLHVESVLYAITEALSVAAGGSATPAEHEHDDYCQEVMCPVPEPSAGRATQGTADERHEPTLGTWSVYSDTSAMFCRCGKRFDNEVHDVQRATQGAAPTPTAELCERGCGEPKHPHRSSYGDPEPMLRFTAEQMSGWDAERDRVQRGQRDEPWPESDVTDFLARDRAGRRDPHCGLTHPHRPTQRCRDGGDDQ